MSSEIFWLSLWLIVGASIVSLAWVIAHGINQNTQTYLDHGFTKKLVPEVYSAEWVKE